MIIPFANCGVENIHVTQLYTCCDAEYLWRGCEYNRRSYESENAHRLRMSKMSQWSQQSDENSISQDDETPPKAAIKV